MKMRELLSQNMLDADIGDIFIKELLLKLGARPRPPPSTSTKKIKVKIPTFTPPPPPLPMPNDAEPLSSGGNTTT